MSRLFITERELTFIADITREIIKDVNGQKIYYYSISESKTKAHELYLESQEKVFDNPIELDALVDTRYQTDTKINAFGVDTQFKLEVFLQYRDLIHKGVSPQVGDFFSFSDIFYEITESQVLRNIYGLPEHKDGLKIIGVKAREGLFKTKILGPTDISHTDEQAIQKTFVQQRGFAENSQGATNDIRELVEAGVLDAPISGPKEVSEKGALSDNSHFASSFYDEES